MATHVTKHPLYYHLRQSPALVGLIPVLLPGSSQTCQDRAQRQAPLSHLCCHTARDLHSLEGIPSHLHCCQGEMPWGCPKCPDCGRYYFFISPPVPSQGLLGNLSLNSRPLSNWLIYPLAIDTAVQQGWPHTALPKSSSGGRMGPAFYTGTFETPGIAWDTFVKFPGWSKVRQCITGKGVRVDQDTAQSHLHHLPGNAVDKWLQPGPVLELPWAPADPVCAWLGAAHWPPQQHHSAGARRGTSHCPPALP